MKAGWQIKTLGEVSKFEGGSQPPKSEFVYEDKKGYIRFIQIRDFSEKERITFIPESKKNRCCLEDDILIGRYGASVGKILTGKKGAYNVALMKTIPNLHIVSREWFYYYLVSFEFQNRLLNIASRSAQDGFSKDDISDFDFPVPPLPEQRRIVAILDEAFADIAAAKEKAEQNLKNAKEVFEIAINNIEGEKVNLGDYVEIKTGKLDANAAEENGKYPFFTCSREIFSINDFSFDCEAVLLAGNNAVGDFNVKHYIGKFNAYQRTYVITADEKKQILCKYLYFQLLSSLKKFKEESVGAATKFLKLGMIKEMKIVLPSIVEQEKIISKLSCIQEQSQTLESIYQQKLDHLEELKKSLLQQAFSGAL